MLAMTLQIEPTMYAYTEAPTSMPTVRKTRSGSVCGVTSPYPTVEMVIVARYSAVK